MSVKFGMLNLFENPEGRGENENVKRNIEVMVQAEALGYDSVWPAEHHFSEYGYLGAPQVSLAAVASRTTRLKLGTGVIILPFHNPIRVAEDFALLDQMSDGRVLLGVGRGYQPMEYRGFGIDQEHSREMFDESLEIITQAWTKERFSFKGKYYTVNDLEVRPKPFQKPTPPIYMAALMPDTFERAGRLGHNLLMAGIFGMPKEQALQGIANYRKGRAAVGLDPAGGRISCLVQIYPGRTTGEAIADFREPVGWYYRTIAKYVAPPAGKAMIKGYELYGNARDIALTASFEQLRESFGLVCGDVDYCTEKLVRMVRELGVDEILCWTDIGTLDRRKYMQALDLFGSQLMPRVRKEVAQMKANAKVPQAAAA
ncbi:MAG: LLM class flavin-dependent oxidoreductase [Nevskia sp.]|nr:LLM class flavin-dependent oxidoreductase [Nevskia sp.]